MPTRMNKPRGTLATRRRAWSNADVKTLKAASRKGTPVKKLARQLGRTEGATRQKAFSIGIPMRAAG